MSNLSNALYLSTYDTGGVSLYHNGSSKLVTTATGIDVTGTVTATGTSVFASLDISGDIDVDGTTNLDVVDIDGATQIDATVTVGVDDTGYDVKFFGATAGAYMLWDESADDLILGGAAGLSVNSTALVTGVLTTTAATVHTGGITMPDNAKAIFGAGDDLEIYHDGSNSIIKDGGTGDLQIRAANFKLNNAEYTTTMLEAYVGGAVSLWYDNAAKLATTATGIDVTGTVAADGLTVDAVTSTFQSTGATAIVLKDTDGGFADGKFNIENGGRDLRISSEQDIILSNATGTLARFDNGGDITFYAADGTTPSFVYDESAGLTINEAGADRDFRVESDGNANMLFVDGGANKVGVGTSSPAATLQVTTATQGAAASIVAAGTDAGIYLEDNSTPTANYYVSKIHTPGDSLPVGGIKFAVSPDGVNYNWAGIKALTTTSGNAGVLAFYVSGSSTSADASTERVRIGALGDFTTNPAAGGHAVFNEGGVDADFRVESDTIAAALTVDGGTGNVGVGSAGLTSTGPIATSSVGAAVTSFKSLCTVGDQTATSLILQSGRTDVYYHMQAFVSGTTEVFRIEASGDVKNTNNSYGAISDAKLKENVVDASPKLADLMLVKVRNYNLIGETTKQIGVVAQELEAVFPSMVDENADRDEDGNLLETTTKGVKYSVFVPMLIKAIQEQQATITALTARITALENA
jgi:hypothetical protein